MNFHKMSTLHIGDMEVERPGPGGTIGANMGAVFNKF
jgi:hypothetical protein